jgi:hypothetical protein
MTNANNLTKSEIKTLKIRALSLAGYLREETNPVAASNLSTDLQVTLNKLDQAGVKYSGRHWLGEVSFG